MKKYRILITFIGIGCLIGIYFWNKNKSFRTPSNVTIDKKLIISKISWKTMQKESEMLIDLSCDDWTSMEVTLKSEGIAYSGEPCRVVQASICGDTYKGFHQIWPHDLKSDYEGIQKIGHDSESPPEWTLEKIKFFGDLGSLELSAIEIYRQTGEIFIFEAY